MSSLFLGVNFNIMLDILIHVGSRFYKLPVDNIVYVVANRRNYYTNISNVYMNDGKRLSVPLNVLKLEDIIKNQLGDKNSLLNIEGTTLINPKYIFYIDICLKKLVLSNFNGNTYELSFPCDVLEQIIVQLKTKTTIQTGDNNRI